MQVKNSQAASLITQCIKARLVPMLTGSPGTGKSDIVRQIAQEYGLKVIDLRLSQCDPTDLMGFPRIDGHRAGYVPMETFPIEGDPVPAGFNGWLLFLDEMNSAPLSVQAAAYKLVLDKMTGVHNLHKKVAIVCAGNKETDNAIVNPMSTAMQSRLVHIELEVDHKEWVDWAVQNDIDTRITSYINFKPGMVYNFDPDHTDKTYACPRTWEFANRILKTHHVDSPDLLPLLAGTISEGVAREFVAFCRIHEELPKIPQIAANPEGIEVPTEPGVLYALTGSISHNASESNIEALIKFVNRMPPEFQVVCLKETVRRNKALMATPAIQSWILTSANELF